MTNTEMLRVGFADGSYLIFPRLSLFEEVVGLDCDGDVLVPLGCGTDLLTPLTPCCYGSGKGSDGGVVCRGCYRRVSSKYGTTAALAVYRCCSECGGLYYSRNGAVCSQHSMKCPTLPPIGY